MGTATSMGESTNISDAAAVAGVTGAVVAVTLGAADDVNGVAIEIDSG
jgi:hypothetical protein